MKSNAKHVKNGMLEYSTDEQGQLHGKWLIYNAQNHNVRVERFYHHGTRHGECRIYKATGGVTAKQYFHDKGKNITHEVIEAFPHIKDFRNMSDEDKFLITLTFGIPCL